MTALWLEITSGEKRTPVFYCSVVQAEYGFPSYAYLIHCLRKACTLKISYDPCKYFVDTVVVRETWITLSMLVKIVTVINFQLK